MSPEATQFGVFCVASATLLILLCTALAVIDNVLATGDPIKPVVILAAFLGSGIVLTALAKLIFRS